MFLSQRDIASDESDDDEKANELRICKKSNAVLYAFLSVIYLSYNTSGRISCNISSKVCCCSLLIPRSMFRAA